MAGSKTGARMPVPSALPSASLAAKRLARKRPGAVLARQVRTLFGGQQLFQCPLAMTLPKRLDALYRNQVGADTVDHLNLAISRIRRFISRTASARPTNTARLTIA